MSLQISRRLLDEIQSHGEKNYPLEGAGLILGKDSQEARRAVKIVPLANRFRVDSRRHRYLIQPEDLIQAEEQAENENLELIGVFHSHPDHPPQPSDFDLQWALPWYLYVITSIEGGKATTSRAWILVDDRSRMIEQPIQIQLTEDEEDR